MATQTPRTLTSPALGRLPPLAELGWRGRLQCRVAADIVAMFFAVSAAEILSARRASAAVSHARHIAIYLAHVAFQLPLLAVSRGFARDRSSISYAIARIEDERDDETFDRLLSRMEQLAQSCRRLALPAAGDEAGEA